MADPLEDAMGLPPQPVVGFDPVLEVGPDEVKGFGELTIQETALLLRLARLIETTESGTLSLEIRGGRVIQFETSERFLLDPKEDPIPNQARGRPGPRRGAA